MLLNLVTNLYLMLAHRRDNGYQSSARYFLG